MDHGGIRSASIIGGRNSEDVSSFLLEVQQLSHGDQTATILRGYGESAPGVAAGYFIV